MAELIEYTPARLPTMTSPAFPDNTRTAIEFTPAVPAEEQKKSAATAKKKKKKTQYPKDPAHETAHTNDGATETEAETEVIEPADTDTNSGSGNTSFIYRAARRPEPDSGYVENPVQEPSEGGNWFSRLIAPPKDELEAANNGLRWHWALEHRFMPPGSKWNETVWQGADRENLWLKNMLKQKNGLDVGIPSAAAIRAREQTRRAILDQYNRALNEYKAGNWDDPERAYNDFKTEVERLREQYRKAGTEYGAEFDPEDLRMPPPISGERRGFTTQTRAVKHRDQWNYANDVNNKLAGWIASGKINDPNFMQSNEVTAYLDSAYETLVKYFKESSNAMADAEKQRLQILALPDSSYDEVVGTIQDFQRALYGLMRSASAKEWSQSNKGKVNEILKAFGFDPKAMDKESLANQMWTLGGIIVSSLARPDELPHDVAQDLEAIKAQLDTYMKNMMLAANVAPHIVANMAYNLAHTSANQYNDQAFAAGRGRADNLGDIIDLTDKISKNAMPVSRLIKRPKFTWPSLAKDPNARVNVSTLPASEGEQNPQGQTPTAGIGSTINFERYK